MPLLVYNRTAAALTLPVGSPAVSLGAAAALGLRGAANNATAELKSLSNANYALLQDMQGSLVVGATVLGSLTASDTDIPFIPPVIAGGGANLVNNVLPQSGYAKIDNEYIHWASHFYAQQALTVALGPADVTATFASTANFASSGFAWVSTSGGDELISWTNKNATQLLGLSRNLRGASNGGATAAIGTLVVASYVSGVTRGQLGSIATTHLNTAALDIRPLIEAEWTTVEEFRTGAWIVNGAADPFPQSDVQSFVDSSLGSDLNLGLASGANAVASLKRLANLIPGSWRRSLIGFLSGSTYAWPEFGMQLMAGNRGAGASPFAFVGAAPVPVAGPFTVGAINADSSIEVGGAFTADQFFGGAANGVANTIRVVTGPLRGQTRMCAGNTTTALLPRNPLTGIQVGDQVIIENARVTVIQIPAGVNAFIGGPHFLGFKGIKFQALAGAVGFGSGDNSWVSMEACTLDLTVAGGYNLTRGGIFATNPNPWGAMLTNNPFSPLRQDGVFIDSRAAAAFGVFISDGARFQATSLLRNCDVNAITAGAIIIGAMSHARNSSVRIAFNAASEQVGPAAASRALWIGKHATAPCAFGSFDNSRMTLNNIMVLGSTVGVLAGGLNVAGPFSNMGGQLALGNVQGDTVADVTTAQAYVPTAVANSGIGVKYQGGSRVMFDFGPSTTRISGTGGDTEGRRPSLDNKSWVSLRVADADGIKGYTDPYGNRIESQA